MNDRDLISAYLDGVGELSADERKRVEAVLRDDPAEIQGARELIAQLRALPGEGTEPDWSALEREIRISVGPQVPSRRPWLRWLVPGAALALGAAIALMVVHPAVPARAPVAVPERTPAGQVALPEAIYLDGEAVDVGDVDPGVLIEDDGSGEALADDSGLLPAQNLEWIDTLDEHALDRAEAWLDHEKGHTKG